MCDGCTSEDEERLLEKVQFEAARIVTGLPSYCSKVNLYRETGWETLVSRRLRRNLCLFYKIVNGYVRFSFSC